MNIFDQYGIKEVADVTIYSIELDENDDEYYTPVLYLDTLKVSTIEQSAEQTSARGGIGNPELITWDYGKTINVTLTDALYSPASQSMVWGGKYKTRQFRFIGTFKYGEGANDKDDLAEFLTDNITNTGKEGSVNTLTVNGRIRYIDSHKERHQLYIKNAIVKWSQDVNGTTWTTSINIPLAGKTFTMDLKKSDIDIQSFGKVIENGMENVYYLDRMEKCIAPRRFCIDTEKNDLHSLYSQQNKYSQCELTVYIDPKTMRPYEANTSSFTSSLTGTQKTGKLREIKQHEIYYKWTRTKAYENTSLGHQIIIDSQHFPGTYRIVGEAYSRHRDTGKDQRFQFEIPLCKMASDNNITLQADGDPTTFDMKMKVMRREDGVMMKLTQYEVENTEYNNEQLSNSTNIVKNAEPSRDLWLDAINDANA